MNILVRGPQRLKELLQSEAKRMGITLNALMLQILWAWVKENIKESEVIK